MQEAEKYLLHHRTPRGESPGAQASDVTVSVKIRRVSVPMTISWLKDMACREISSTQT